MDRNSLRYLALLCLSCWAAAQDHKPPIRGEITEAKALKWLFNNTGSASVVATQRAVVNGQQQWILYTSVPDHGDCHACPGILGAAVFVKKGNTWVNQLNEANVAEVGSFGMVGIGKPMQWGKDSYGLIVTGGWIGQGLAYGNDVLYGFDGGSLRQIANIPVSFSNTGSMAPEPEQYDWDAEWTFLPPGVKGVYDIVVKIKSESSKERTQKFAKESGTPPPVPGTYRYDGTVFRNLKTNDPL